MLIPWYHYVPTKLDYSDILYVILLKLICLPAKKRHIDEFFFFFVQRYLGILSGIT